MSAYLEQVADLVRRESGIELKPNQMSGLAAALARITPGMDAERFLEQASDPAVAPAVIARLMDEVTVKETYFFREPREIEAIDWAELLRGARERGSDRVRIWVAACATGEEAYSIAMLAGDAFGHGDPPISILATDISPAALAVAERGVYSGRSIRAADDEVRERHFVQGGKGYAVSERVRALVRFRRHNLVRDPLPPVGEAPFELISCRNVLIYFSRETVERVIEDLEGALQPAGTLILGAADRLTGSAGRLSRLDLTVPAPVERRARRRMAPRRTLRRPLGLEPDAGSVAEPAAMPERRAEVPSSTPRRRSEDRIEDALWAADEGEVERAIAIAEGVLAEDPLHADAYFVLGMAQLAAGEAQSSVASLRRAVYVDPSFGLAAFQLGRAHDACGDLAAARRSYEQALRTLDPDDERHRTILEQVDVGDVAAACQARLQRVREAS